LGGLTMLYQLYLFGNELTGTMPDDICLIEDLDLTADCLSEVTCSCCDTFY